MDGIDDEDIPGDSHNATEPCARQDGHVSKGPMTQSRMQRLQREVNSLLVDYEHASTKSCLRPNSGALHVLTFTYEDKLIQVLWTFVGVLLSTLPYEDTTYPSTLE